MFLALIVTALLGSTPEEQWTAVEEKIIDCQNKNEAAFKERCKQIKDFLSVNSVSARQLAEAIKDTVEDGQADILQNEKYLLEAIRPIVGDIKIEPPRKPSTLGEVMARDVVAGPFRKYLPYADLSMNGDSHWVNTYNLMAAASEYHPDPAIRETCHNAAQAMRKGCNIGILRYLGDVDRCRTRKIASEAYFRLFKKRGHPMMRRKHQELPPDSQLKRQAKDAVKAVEQFMRKKRAAGLPAVYG